MSASIWGFSYLRPSQVGRIRRPVQQKEYKAVGKLNAIWANHKGIGFGEEIQLWMTYGWSTLGFGCELWPWGDCLWAEKVESVMLRTLLQQGQLSSNVLAHRTITSTGTHMA